MQIIPTEESKDFIKTWNIKLSKRAQYEKSIYPYMKRKEELLISNFFSAESTYLQKTLAKRNFFFRKRVFSLCHNIVFVFTTAQCAIDFTRIFSLSVVQHNQNFFKASILSVFASSRMTKHKENSKTNCKRRIL